MNAQVWVYHHINQLKTLVVVLQLNKDSNIINVHYYDRDIVYITEEDRVSCLQYTALKLRMQSHMTLWAYSKFNAHVTMIVHAAYWMHMIFLVHFCVQYSLLLSYSREQSTGIASLLLERGVGVAWVEFMIISAYLEKLVWKAGENKAFIHLQINAIQCTYNVQQVKTLIIVAKFFFLML